MNIVLIIILSPEVIHSKVYLKRFSLSNEESQETISSHLTVSLTLPQIGAQKPLKYLSLLLFVAMDFSVLNWDLREDII